MMRERLVIMQEMHARFRPWYLGGSVPFDQLKAIHALEHELAATYKDSDISTFPKLKRLRNRVTKFIEKAEGTNALF